MILAFTSVETVQLKAYAAGWIMILGVFFDNWALQIFGIAKGLGVHRRLVGPIFICCWVVNLTLCILLAFTYDWDFQGIWSAIVIS